MKDYQILLFYKYVHIEDPVALMESQVELCKKLDLKCRIIIAEEGVNGTLEGEYKNTEAYIREMKKDPRFADVHWKRSEGTGVAFPKINIKVRNEIVALKLDGQDIDPNVTTGKYITADELHELYESGEEFYVVDMRNDYEQRIGHFENAYLVPMQNFRELPDHLNPIIHLKHKKVITTCTGGIRCEKASGLLVAKGFTDVYQLYGGMQTYMEKYPNGYFKGKLYVFDGRVVWGNRTDDEATISHCDRCGAKSDLYVDCGYLHCKGHRHFISCKNCIDENGYAFCSDECRAKAYAENKFCDHRYAVKREIEEVVSHG